MTLRIHWSKCDAPLTEVVVGVQWVSTDWFGLTYRTTAGEQRTVPVEMADGWELAR